MIADLYVGDNATGPLFMEIKTPLPNIDICAESKKKILIFEEMKRNDHGRGYLAFAYNPFVTRDKYAHSYTKTVMDLKEEVLMGEEMWDKLGGKGTYDELINVVDKAGEAKRRELEDGSKDNLCNTNCPETSVQISRLQGKLTKSLADMLVSLPSNLIER